MPVVAVTIETTTHPSHAFIATDTLDAVTCKFVAVGDWTGSEFVMDHRPPCELDGLTAVRISAGAHAALAREWRLTERGAVFVL